MFTFTEKMFTESNQFSNNTLWKISAQTHTILKQYRSPKGNLLFTPLFSLSKNYMHNKVWCCAEILSAVINMTSFLTPWSCTLSFTHGTLPLFQLAGLSKFVLGSHCLVTAKHWFPAKLIKTLNLLKPFHYRGLADTILWWHCSRIWYKLAKITVRVISYIIHKNAFFQCKSRCWII